MAKIELIGVIKTRKQRRILDNITFTFEHNTLTTIQGPSGAGKTTLLRLLAMLDLADVGVMKIDGVEIKKLNQQEKRKVGIVFQNFGLFPHLSLKDNLLIAPNILGYDKPESQQHALKLIDFFGLTNQIDTPIELLSGGEKQRLAIARALMLDPEIILFDEPTSALDSARVGDLIQIMKDLITQGKTLVVVTHDENFAQRLEGKKVTLKDGKINSYI